MPSVGENVIRLRELRGWSQGNLAERLGLTQPSMWKIEKGTPNWRKVELATLFKLAAALECSIEDLVVGLDTSYDELRAGDHDPAAARVRAHPVLHEERADASTPAGADVVLLPSVTSQQRHGEETLASARDEIERILADLTAVAKKLPRRQATVDRRSGSGSAPRPRRPRGPSDRKASKKRPPRRPRE